MKRAALITLALLTIALPSAAELSVTLDDTGSFSGFYRDMAPENGLIWEKTSLVDDSLVLNRWGDDLGDRKPSHDSVIMPGVPDETDLSDAEDAERESMWVMPMAVWPHPMGDDTELAYSTFCSGRWSDYELVELIDNKYDDHDPVLLGLENQAVLVWWQAEPSPVALHAVWDGESFSPAERTVRASASHPVPFRAPNGQVYAGLQTSAGASGFSQLDWEELTDRLITEETEIPATAEAPASALIALETDTAPSQLPLLSVWSQIDDRGVKRLVASSWDDDLHRWSEAKPVSNDSARDVELVPTLLISRTRALLAWTQSGDDGGLFTSSYSVKHGWSSPELIVPHASKPRFFATFSGRVFLGYSTGSDSSHRLEWMRMADWEPGSEWTTTIPVGDITKKRSRSAR